MLVLRLRMELRRMALVGLDSDLVWWCCVAYYVLFKRYMGVVSEKEMRQGKYHASGMELMGLLLLGAGFDTVFAICCTFIYFISLFLFHCLFLLSTYLFISRHI